MSPDRSSSRIFCLFSTIALLAVLLPGCQPGMQTATEQPIKEDPVARGKYLVMAGACHDCHTPFKMGPKGPEPDMSRMLSGHPETLKMGPPPKLENGWVYAGSGTNTAYVGPWGVTYAINLTPDQNTGLGIWTQDQFVKAIKTGKHFGVSRPILPPMPWQSYSNMTDEDLKAIYAYLRSVPPISNHVPDYEPPPETTAP